MDDHQLDDIARSLASATSRRTFVRAMVGAATAGLLGLTGRAAGAAKPAKVTICHWDNDSGSYKIIEVSENAVPAHAAHRGDVTHVNLQNDASNCGSCGNACNSGEICEGGTCKCGLNVACNAGETCEAGACGCGPNVPCNPNEMCEIDEPSGLYMCRCGAIEGCGRTGSCDASSSICMCGDSPACYSGTVCSPANGTCGGEGEANPT